MLLNRHPRALMLITIVLRIVVGGVFVVSGVTKMIDPWGFVFKIDDYLAVWHTVVPQALVAVGAMMLSCVEFCSGILLATGCYRRVSLAIVSAIMAVMLPLTVYIAVANPVTDCGCFGDWIIISNTATLLKNIAIVAMIVALWFTNRSVAGSIPNTRQWQITVLSTIYIAAVGLLGYNVQPMIDFRPYAPGASLIADDADGDDTMIFVYAKGGVEQEFTVDNLPDSTWTFVNRRATVDAIADNRMMLADGEGEPVQLSDIVDPDDLTLLVLIADPSQADASATFNINQLHDAVNRVGGNMIAIVGASTDAIAQWRDFALADYDIYTADPTDIKILVRGNVALVLTRSGIVEWKRTLNSFDPDLLTDINRSEQLVSELRNPGVRAFGWLTAIYILLAGLTAVPYRKLFFVKK